MCLPKCLGGYKTFLCRDEDCSFTEVCEEKRAFNIVKKLVDKFSLDITEEEIKETIKEIKNAEFFLNVRL